MSTHQVTEYRLQTSPHGARELAFVGVIAGLGRNAGTWDSAHTQRTAQRHARALRKAHQGTDKRFYVETTT